MSSNQTKATESTKNKDEVRDTKVNVATEQSNESQSKKYHQNKGLIPTETKIKLVKKKQRVKL